MHICTDWIRSGHQLQSRECFCDGNVQICSECFLKIIFCIRSHKLLNGIMFHVLELFEITDCSAKNQLHSTKPHEVSTSLPSNIMNEECLRCLVKKGVPFLMLCFLYKLNARLAARTALLCSFIMQIAIGNGLITSGVVAYVIINSCCCNKVFLMFFWAIISVK